MKSFVGAVPNGIWNFDGTEPADMGPSDVSSSSSPVRVAYNLINDAILRRTDPDLKLSTLTEDGPLIDLKRFVLGAWMPDAPASDLFSGRFALNGEFLYLKLVLMGVVNPPGRSFPGAFEPFRYGDRPVYGFVEINMDGDWDTGGEIDAPQYRYLGNVARFGGMPVDPMYHDRVAAGAQAFDRNVLTPPFVERSGEEFHLALLGDQFLPNGIRVVEGNGNQIFEAGETWDIQGRFFHRAHGFEPFSFAEGDRGPGSYEPMCTLRFQHDVFLDETSIILVFPLTNHAAGLALGESPEPLNHDPTDHASVLEALGDLKLSAEFLRLFPTGLPEEALIQDWADKNPMAHLFPPAWKVSALLGTAYAEPDPRAEYFVWTDIYPNVVRGDVTGSGRQVAEDRLQVNRYRMQHDALDGMLDGRAVIPNFARNFSLYDLNYDGVVDGRDVALSEPLGDATDDGQVTMVDFGYFQRCFGMFNGEIDTCGIMDLNEDGIIDYLDYQEFSVRFRGPLGIVPPVGQDGNGP
jgi:hypothetical protein